MDMKCDGLTDHLERPVGFMIISATLTEVMTVACLPVLVICAAVPKGARATLAVHGRGRRRDGCDFRSWAQAGAEPAVHGGSRDGRDQRRDVKGERGVKSWVQGKGSGEQITCGQGKARRHHWKRKSGEAPFWTEPRHEASSEALSGLRLGRIESGCTPVRMIGIDSDRAPRGPAQSIHTFA